MQTKLTLRMDDQLVRAAKQHARQSGCSVSRMVSDYFAAIVAAEFPRSTLTPKVSRLMGSLKDASLDEADYRAHLEGKYV